MQRVHNPKFVKAYETFREHYAWFSRRSEAGDLSIPDSKAAVAEMREFLDRWMGKTGLAEMDRGLADFSELVASIERALEREALDKLLKVLEKRGDWAIGERMLKATVAFIELMKVAPEELRPGMLKIHRDAMGKDYDAETEYRECEEDTEANRREYEEAWKIYAADWPERATPEVREQVAAVEGEPLGAWVRELAAQRRELESE